MTTPPDDALLFEVDVPAPPTPVERLLALADLYTRHNDQLDALLIGRRPYADPSAHTTSAQRLERETLTAVNAVKAQRLRPCDTVANTVVRLKQLAYLSGGATRYLAAAQEALPGTGAEPEHLDPHRGVGQYVQVARELTGLAPGAAVDCASHIAGEMRCRSGTRAPTHDLDPALCGALLEVARGHITVAEDLGREHVYWHTVVVGIERLRRLEAQDLITREPSSAPPAYRGGLPRARARLTAHGISTVGALIEPPPQISLLPRTAGSAPSAASAPRARR
ncbi:hypothetical protein AQI95_36005 [Streptomyces yokosukanensis]|uniref:Uncharacterized protein n=1 Tax=Streptomyces yokosukanensis TaxID=67386 RepID=A0A124HE84_9ACTN|nr:hypothetical protein [Streptomyces yokosukanensis]KUM99921.1 hypothetical protein AQI95_36005 [Streptomyces yokosukanensis]